jgi:hypothetical protein
MFNQNIKSETKTRIEELSFDSKNLSSNEKTISELSEEEQVFFVGGLNCVPCSSTSCNDTDYCH